MSDAVNTLSWYLEHVGRIPLLTAADEVDLARRAVAGREACRRLSTPEATPGEVGRRARLRVIARDGQRAGERLTEANLRLVISISRRYQGRGLDLLDLVQEGNLGLLTAVERFDPTRGYRFSTYASWWIRQAVASGLARRGRPVRLPLHAYETAQRVHATELAVLQTTGMLPSDEELAARLDLRLPRLREIRLAARDVVSLDRPLRSDDSGGATVGDRVRAPADAGPESLVGAAMGREELGRALATLSTRERDVVELRYGLRDGRERTLQELGRELGITRERVRQIEQRALRKLSRPRLDGLLDTAS